MISTRGSSEGDARRHAQTGRQMLAALIIIAGSATAAIIAAPATRMKGAISDGGRDRIIPTVIAPVIPPATAPGVTAPTARGLTALEPRSTLDRAGLLASSAPLVPAFETRPPLRIVGVEPQEIPLVTLPARADPRTAQLATNPIVGITEPMILSTTPALRAAPTPFLKLAIPDPDDSANTPAIPPAADVLPSMPAAPLPRL